MNRAAEQGARAISNLNAYAKFKDLDKTICSKTDVTWQKILGEVADLVNDVAQENQRVLWNMSDRIQSISALMNGDEFPCFTDTPRFVAVQITNNVSQEVTLPFGGLLANSRDWSLSIRDKSYTPYDGNRDQLKFRVSLEPLEKERVLGYQEGTLKARVWIKKSWGTEEATYKFLVGELVSAGELKVFSTPKGVPPTKCRSLPFIVSPHPKQWAINPFAVSPSEGMQGRRGSSSLIWVFREGQTSHKLVEELPQRYLGNQSKDGSGLCHVAFEEEPSPRKDAAAPTQGAAAPAQEPKGPASAQAAKLPPRKQVTVTPLEMGDS